MKKRHSFPLKLIFCIIVLSVPFLSSCRFEENRALDGSIRDSHMFDGDTFVYQNMRYFPVENGRYFQVQHSGDVMISWSKSWLTEDNYYADTFDSPLFVYDMRANLYFREDYEYLSDTYVIQDTEIEVIYSEIFDSEDTLTDWNISSENASFYCEIPMQSKTNSNISISAELLKVDNNWYLSFYQNPSSDKRKVWVPSQAFLDLLKRNNLLTQ